MNGDDGTISSRATDYYHSLDFDLAGYANRAMRVSVAVDGDHVQVYFDQTKVADSRLFDNNPARYFFIDAPIRSEHGAKLAIGNVRMAGFN